MKILIISGFLATIACQENFLPTVAKSNETSLAWRWMDDIPIPGQIATQEVLFNYYTSMDIRGDVWAHFTLGLTEVAELPPAFNIRLGFGYRPWQKDQEDTLGVGGSVFGPVTSTVEDRDHTPINPQLVDRFNDGTKYDINICHMRRFETRTWVLKDMFMDDLQEATSYKYSEKGERDNNWILEENAPESLNKNTGILTCYFKRRLIGSTKNDYTMMLNEPIEIQWTFGAWQDDQQTRLGNCVMSPRYMEESREGGAPNERFKRNITLYPPDIVVAQVCKHCPSGVSGASALLMGVTTAVVLLQTII